jgi:hypothetical protein
VEGPLADAELLLEPLERTEDALPCGGLPAFIHDNAREGHPEAHSALQDDAELGRQRHHPLVAGLRRHHLVGRERVADEELAALEVHVADCERAPLAHASFSGRQ